jgi:hypothetical protein
VVAEIREPYRDAMRRMTRRSTLFAGAIPAVLMAALALGGCSASGGGSSESGGQDSGVVAPDAPAENDFEGPSLGDEGAVDGSGGGVTAEEPRDVITVGEVIITAEAPLEAAEDAVRIVETAGGRVDARTEHAPRDGDEGSATLVLRIPADELTATLEELKDLGRADEVDLHSSDVTVQHQDLAARISAQESMIASLRGLMARATAIDDLIMLESTIAERQAHLESLQAQQRGLEDQISMSTITLVLRSEAQAPPPPAPVSFLSGLVTGWDGFVAFWSGFLVVVAVLLPWLVTAGIITFGVIWFVRWNRRRQASRPQPPTAGPGVGPTLPPPTLTSPPVTAPAPPPVG